VHAPRTARQAGSACRRHLCALTWGRRAGQHETSMVFPCTHTRTRLQVCESALVGVHVLWACIVRAACGRVHPPPPLPLMRSSCCRHPFIAEEAECAPGGDALASMRGSRSGCRSGGRPGDRMASSSCSCGGGAHGQRAPSSPWRAGSALSGEAH